MRIHVRLFQIVKCHLVQKLILDIFGRNTMQNHSVNSPGHHRMGPNATKFRWIRMIRSMLILDRYGFHRFHISALEIVIEFSSRTNSSVNSTTWSFWIFLNHTKFLQFSIEYSCEIERGLRPSAFNGIGKYFSRMYLLLHTLILSTWTRQRKLYLRWLLLAPAGHCIHYS